VLAFGALRAARAVNMFDQPWTRSSVPTNRPITQSPEIDHLAQMIPPNMTDTTPCSTSAKVGIEEIELSERLRLRV
jgi:hypothetical protein